MKRVLDPVFRRGAGRPAVRLGPEVARVRGMAAEFEGNEVILLVVRRIRVCVTVLSDLPDFQAGRIRRWRPNRLRVTRHADRLRDVFLSYVGVYDARRAVRIGEG